MDAQQEFLSSLNSLLDKISLLSKTQFSEALKGYKPAEVHTIQFIGKHQNVNVTTIAQALFVTRGAVSKMTQRLMKRELVESYQKSNNKKEIYFRLTAKGKSVFKIHEHLDQEFAKRDQPLFANAAPQQVDNVLDFLSQYNQYLDKEIEKQKLSIK